MAKKLCYGCMSSYEASYGICPRCGYSDDEGAKQCIAPGTALQGKNGKYIIGAEKKKDVGVTRYIGLNIEKNAKVYIDETYFAEDVCRKNLKKLEKISKITGSEKFIERIDNKQNGDFWIFECSDGKNIDRLMAENGIFNCKDAIRLIVKVLEITEKLQKTGVSHPRICSQNVVVNKDSNVVLSGFVFDEKDYSGLSQRELEFIAPEVTESGAKEQSAVFSIAVLLYNMLSGEMPNRNSNGECIYEKDSVIPTEIRKILKKALETNTAKRTKTCAEFRNQLEAVEIKDKPDGSVVKDMNRRQADKNFAKYAVVVGIVFFLLVSVLIFVIIIKKDKNKKEVVLTQKEEIRVPDVIGMDLDEAKKLLNDKGFAFIISGREDSDEYSLNTIIKQQPGAEEVFAKGSTIELVISNGAIVYVLPDIIGIDYQEAIKRLKECGIPEDNITCEKTDGMGIAAGCVVSIAKNEGETLREGATIGTDDRIVIYVARDLAESDEEVELCDFKGMTEKEATEKADELGIALKMIKEYSEDYAKGIVYNQKIREGSYIKKGSTVDVYVSMGKKMILVPDVIYKEQKAAEELLKKSGFMVESKFEYSDTVLNGLVTRQSLEKGKEVADGEHITIWISQGSEKNKSASEEKTNRTESNNSVSEVEEEQTTEKTQSETKAPTVTKTETVTKTPTIKAPTSKASPTKVPTTKTPTPKAPDSKSPTITKDPVVTEEPIVQPETPTPEIASGENADRATDN